MPHGNGVLVVHHVFRPDASLQILEVGEHDGAGLVDRPQRFEHAPTVGPERSVWPATGRDDRHVRAGDLRDQLGEAARNCGAMRHDHEPDQAVSVRSCHSTAFYNAERHSTMLSR